MAKSIVIIGTLDTKGEEVKYVKELIEGRGHQPIVIDGGTLGEPPFPPDISNGEVAEAAGAIMKEVVALNEAEAIKVMAEGASKIAQELYSSGRLNGVIALGGGMGTWLGLAVMRDLPLGVPKLMVSTTAFTPIITSGMVSSGQMLTDCVAGLWGLNAISRVMLENAVGAISGMVESNRKIVPEKPLIGVSTLGSAALDYVFQIKPLLEKMGWEAAVFHSVGPGGRDFEQLIEQGLITGALDLCLFELANHVCGGAADSGPNRLEAAGRKGIPQVVAPGAIGFFVWAGPPETVPARFKDRFMQAHNPSETIVMTNLEERALIGKLVAEKLNRAIGPAAAIIPVPGFSKLEKPGSPIYKPDADRAFIEALKKHIEPRIEVVDLDVHISDPAFAQEAVAILGRIMRAKNGD